MPASESLYTVQTDGQLQPWLGREWLLTNGLGSFASSTVLGCNIRRYHGVLCAATLPPVGRVMSLNRIAETIYLDGEEERPHELSMNQFRQALHPRGDQYLRAFDLGDVARWTYDVEGVRIVKELQLLWQRNVVGVRYTIDAGRARKVRLDLSPFTALRDFHAMRRASDGAHFQVKAENTPAVAKAIVTVGSQALMMGAIGAGNPRFIERHDWWYDHVYPIETDRGQDDAEDLFCPGRFTAEGDEGKLSLTLWISPTSIEQQPDWDAELARRAAFRAGYDPKGASRSPTIRRLFRAAEDFVVGRRAPDGSHGTSVLAGYPWFADWGRDTFIALPGLLLTTGRFTEAKQVLELFGQYVSDGMIPNRFDDYNNEPSYNTVDASLWYIHAAFEYLRLSGDKATFEKSLRSACQKIIDGYKAGTRFHIKMTDDGLVTQGDEHTQLTWMDAKNAGIAFTPRQGKAVEINALWYHALVLTGETELAAKVGESFRKAFWISPFRGLADVVDAAGNRDAKIRPNQIFAASLPNSPLTPEQRSAVVEIVRRELLTPMGLRTLNATDPQYHPRYTGPQRWRDEGYHNGTVWAWPIGAFLDAYLRANERSPESVEQARAWLRPLIEHMETNCVGQIAEIFEADPPHRPVGCPAQAWSVAEVLRLAVELNM